MKKLFFIAILFSLVSFSQTDSSKRLLMLGDSLTEGFGVAKEAAFPALVEKKIQESGKKWIVVNAGVSGSTTASGVKRLQWQIKNKPDLIVLALGANDGLRGLSIAQTEKNLSDTIDLAVKEKIKVVLVGMFLPPNYGAQYTKDFGAMYDRLAKKYSLKKIPFLLEGVAGVSSLNLADGIHPNEKGHAVIAETVFKNLRSEL